jgi:type IV secretory pathway TrbL component
VVSAVSCQENATTSGQVTEAAAKHQQRSEGKQAGGTDTELANDSGQRQRDRRLINQNHGAWNAENE